MKKRPELPAILVSMLAKFNFDFYYPRRDMAGIIAEICATFSKSDRIAALEAITYVLNSGKSNAELAGMVKRGAGDGPAPRAADVRNYLDMYRLALLNTAEGR